MTTPDMRTAIHDAALLAVRMHKDSHLLGIKCDSEAGRRAVSFHAALDLMRLRGANHPITFDHLIAAYREFESLLAISLPPPPPHPPLTNMGFDGGDSTLDTPIDELDDGDETIESSDEDIEHLRGAGIPPTLLEHPYIPPMDPD